MHWVAAMWLADLLFVLRSNWTSVPNEEACECIYSYRVDQVKQLCNLGMQQKFRHKTIYRQKNTAETGCYDDSGKNCGPTHGCVGHTGQLSTQIAGKCREASQVPFGTRVNTPAEPRRTPPQLARTLQQLVSASGLFCVQAVSNIPCGVDNISFSHVFTWAFAVATHIPELLRCRYFNNQLHDRHTELKHEPHQRHFFWGVFFGRKYIISQSFSRSVMYRPVHDSQLGRSYTFYFEFYFISHIVKM